MNRHKEQAAVSTHLAHQEDSRVSVRYVSVTVCELSELSSGE